MDRYVRALNVRTVRGFLHHHAQICAARPQRYRRAEQRDVKGTGLLVKLNRSSVGKQYPNYTEQPSEYVASGSQCNIPRICIGWNRIQIPAAYRAHEIAAQGATSFSAVRIFVVY